MKPKTSCSYQFHQEAPSSNKDSFTCRDIECILLSKQATLNYSSPNFLKLIIASIAKADQGALRQVKEATND